MAPWHRRQRMPYRLTEEDGSVFSAYGTKSRCMKALAVLPVIYTWSLPLLSVRTWKWKPGEVNEIGDWNGLRFGNQCKNAPRCEDTYCGLSVSEYISTPMATATMACVYFAPMVQLWSMKSSLECALPHGTTNLVTFLVFWNIFFMVPVTQFNGLHILTVCIFSTCGLRLYYGMLLNVSVCETRLLKLFLLVSVFSFGLIVALCLTAQVCQWWGIPNIVVIYAPSLFYILEACGLTCTCLFPWFWHNSIAGFVHHRGRMRHRHTFKELKKSSRTASNLMRMICLLPVVYVWALPLLASDRVGFAYKCKDKCVYTVSTFLSSTASTGAFAALFFWPLAHLWSHKHEFANTFYRRFSLHIFLLSFAAYLIFNDVFHAIIHYIATAVFAVSALTVYVQVCSQSSGWKKHAAAALIIIAFCSCTTLSACWIYEVSTRKLMSRVSHLPWALEAVAFTCMAIFPWCWESPINQLHLPKEENKEGTEIELAAIDHCSGMLGGVDGFAFDAESGGVLFGTSASLVTSAMCDHDSYGGNWVLSEEQASEKIKALRQSLRRPSEEVNANRRNVDVLISRSFSPRPSEEVKASRRYVDALIWRLCSPHTHT